ncbi:MAG: sulfatase-like hydrolase/transferase [Chloroflexota bacterium]
MSLSNRPNLLYIHTDQHTPYVLGCYGDQLVQTPHLDHLAANGVVFENAYCTSPICVPSRMSMLSGRHPYQNEVWTNEHGLDSATPTVAHALGAAGYKPVLAGRMHAIGPDQLHGYAERFVGDHRSNYLGGSPVDRGVLDGASEPERASLERSGSGQSAYQIHDEYVTAAAIDYLNRHAVGRQATGANEPFCLTVGFMLPHAPFVARREDFLLYKDKISLPKKQRPFSNETHPHLRWWRQHTGIAEVTEAEVLRARAAYWGLVTRVDAMIGQILEALAKNGLADNTLIIYTSDHGDMLGEHGLWWKHVFYEESVKVPLIISWPEVIPAGQRCERVVSAVDVTATILDAVSAPALPNGSGQSFLRLINGRSDPSDWDDIAFAEYCSDEFCPEGSCYQRMVRQGDWKLIYYHGQPPQLFNLAEDPDELEDRANDPTCQAIREGLTAVVLQDWDPEAIKLKMAAQKADTVVLKQWAQNIQPPDIYRWPLHPDMNYLDEPPVDTL